MQNEGKKSSKKSLLLTGVLAAGAVAAGYYFYKSPDAKKHRRIASRWTGQFKKDVLAAARKTKQIDRKTIDGIIGQAAQAYRGMKQVDRAELERAARELKRNWQNVAREIGRSISATKKTVKQTAKKATKRARG